MKYNLKASETIFSRILTMSDDYAAEYENTYTLKQTSRPVPEIHANF